jgi:hypothetical protein
VASFVVAFGGAIATGSGWWIVLFPVGILLSYRFLD